MSAFAGFEFPTGGEWLRNGDNFADMPPFRRPINPVFQSLALFLHSSVAENISFGLRMLGRSKAEVADRVADLLRKEMQLELQRIQHETGITFIFVTHDQEDALKMSDRIAVINCGRVLQVGNPHKIHDAPTWCGHFADLGLGAKVMPAGRVVP